MFKYFTSYGLSYLHTIRVTFIQMLHILVAKYELLFNARVFLKINYTILMT
jgi:hypothetical protein